MRPINAKSDVKMCPNCDVVQERETLGKKRAQTERDYAFTKVWRQRILSYFPGQRL